MGRKPRNCADCGIPISHYATYCMAHRFIGSRNPIYGKSRPESVKRALSAAQRGVPEPPRQPKKPSTAKSGRSQANRLFKKPATCEDCGEAKPLDWHHINDDATDNRRENLAALCRRCHQIRDGRHDRLKHEIPALGQAALRRR